MAYSDEDLDKYLKKAQEVLNSKNEDYLSKKDLQDIAQKLDLDLQEIAQAKQDYLTRGDNHLRFGNYKEAIDEYEQLLLLDPKDPKSVYGLAKAYLEKWHQDGKKNDKEKALAHANNCIEIDPGFQEAYAIVGELKQKPQGKKATQSAQKTAPKTPPPQRRANASSSTFKKKRGRGTLIGFAIFGAVVLIQLGISYYKSKGTSQYMVGATPKGIVVWQIKYTKHKKSPYYRKPKLLIAQAATGKLLHEMDLPERKNTDGNRLWYKVSGVDGSFYDYYNNGFVARDMRTGKITNSKALLAQKFPEIEGGVGKVRHYNSGWFEITSKQGRVHWYNPNTKKLLTVDEYRQRKQTQPYWQYQWTKVANPKNRNQYQFLLTQRLSNRRLHQGKHQIGNTRLQFLQKSVDQGDARVISKQDKANFFLKPKVIYVDSTHILLRYQTEIGKQSNYRLACIGKTGDVLWEKGMEDVEVPLLQNFLSNYGFNPKFARYKNELGISSVQVRGPKKTYPLYRMAVGIDLNSGKVLWKHSPRYYSTKFK